MKSRQQKPQLQPGPDHPITIEPTHGRVVVRLGGKTIVDSNAAVTLQECDYLPVQYVPRSDVDMTWLKRSDHSTYCPYKGDASYFHVAIDGSEVKNAVWSYEDPYDAVDSIKDRLAFYPDRVDSIEVTSSK